MLIQQCGFFGVTGSRINAGQVEVDRMQNSSRIPVQWGGSQTIFGGRADELTAQPIDESFPVFDVLGHGFNTEGIA